MKASEKDVIKIASLIKELWPKLTIEQCEIELIRYFTDEDSEVFIEVIDGKFVGVALCKLRYDYVEGCKYKPVGFLEGIVVDENYRMKNIARNLCGECENWAKDKGCKEFASDCELNNTDSLNFHLNIGFKEQNRIICFKKNL